ncbi:Cupin domain-containing protein [Pseudomonas sp. NFR09]|uniref:helix-turn-helix domain-containing protein n=1 Tax=Pseudomonas sp. NFR09 TaxID=1566249 RepID=UPI0008ABEA7F|nr:XRE family transcriptional regulator [Pseudomonas sp. NFR09]SET63785.1 Cupin domain-containing protein [Pseudomonas sp. NFR09]
MNKAVQPVSRLLHVDGSTAVAHFLGQRIRALRKRRHMTQAELALTSKLPASHISQLERGLAYPSIPTLSNIARCLGVTNQWFFVSTPCALPEDNCCVGRESLYPSIRYEDGIVDELLSFRPNRQIEMQRLRFPPSVYRTQSAGFEGEQACHLLSGRFELWVGGRYFKLEPGDSVSFTAQGFYRYGNPGQAEAVLIWVCTSTSPSE